MFSASESGLPAKFPLHADAAAKAELFRERYTILHQVIVSPSWIELYIISISDSWVNINCLV